MTLLEEMKLITEEQNEQLLLVYLKRAEKDILNYTNRSRMLPEFEGVQLDLAIASYNNRGVENVKSNSEGGISTTFIIKDEILATLKNKRLARVGGVVFEKEQEEEVLD